MLICKGDKSYKCNITETNTIRGVKGIRFAILEPISSCDVAELFEDNTFYFYDDVLNGRLPDTDNMKMVGLRITYNADSTCTITIKLLKGDVDDEG